MTAALICPTATELRLTNSAKTPSVALRFPRLAPWEFRRSKSALLGKESFIYGANAGCHVEADAGFPGRLDCERKNFGSATARSAGRYRLQIRGRHFARRIRGRGKFGSRR